ncbi:TolC family outer membrane protein [Paraburkholderia phenoliruptrix]|uniref:TolC family outer membrane protein n=3 Tax=Paraburkholderia phenoliruptrix TaxID=252970 RepID=A0ABV3WCQ2_9BURK|nr:TolC family outer membrane protein [Paraburkholderia phenoliruptrix]MDR6389567.1 outer membrane protein [Paraburkholderia phenoliruptrix]
MNKRALTGALVMLATVAYAGAAAAVDLLGVVERSTDHDADLAAFRAGSRAAGQAVPKARAALLPQVVGGWGRAYNSVVTEGLPNTHYWQSGWTVVLTQPVFDWSKWTTYRQADFVAARGAVDFARARQAVILRAVEAYFDELAAEDEMTRANDYAATLDLHLSELVRKRRVGEATVIDVRDAEAAREQAQLQQQDARDEVHLKRLALEHLTGEPFEALSRVSEAAGLPGLSPPDVESWASQAAAHDYTVQQKQVDHHIAELEVEKARAARLPVVSLTASHTPAGAASGYMRPTTTTTAMLSVTIPIFEGGANTATIDEKLALQDKAQDELVAATRTAGASAREYWSRFHAGVARVDVLSRVVQSSQAALDATKVGYRVGSRASTDVLRASEAYFANRRDLIRARYATVMALLQLKAAAASLDVDEIARVNELLLNGAVGGGIVADAEAGRKPASAEVKQGVAPADARHSAPITNMQPALAEADTRRPKFDADVLRALSAIRP